MRPLRPVNLPVGIPRPPIVPPWNPLTVIPFLNGWTAYSPSIPQMYWDVYSQEERIKRILLFIDLMEHYLDVTTSKINELVDRFEDLSDKEKALLEYAEALGKAFEEEVAARIAGDESLADQFNKQQAEQTVFLKDYVNDQLSYLRAAMEEDIRNAKLDDLDIISPGDSYTGAYHTLHETLEDTYRDLNSWALDADTVDGMELTAEQLDAMGNNAEELDLYPGLIYALAGKIDYLTPLEEGEDITDALGVLKALNHLIGGEGSVEILADRVADLEWRVSVLEADAPTPVTNSEIDEITEGE